MKRTGVLAALLASATTLAAVDDATPPLTPRDSIARSTPSPTLTQERAHTLDGSDAGFRLSGDARTRPIGGTGAIIT